MLVSITITPVRRLGPVMIVTTNKYKHGLISILARKYLEEIDENDSIGVQIATRSLCHDEDEIFV
jgi:hypothetical protein